MFENAVFEGGREFTEFIGESSDPIVITLSGSISSGEGEYKLLLKCDGKGEIYNSGFPDDKEEFDHEIKVDELSREIEEAVQKQFAVQSERDEFDTADIEEIRRDTTSERLEEVFWEQINQTLEDPFFRSFYDEDWGEDFRCERGTVEEFTNFLKLCLLTERDIKDTDDFLVVEAETEIDAAGLTDFSYCTQRLAELVEIACEYFEPRGFTYDYNDGCYDRMSGYSMNSATISFSLDEFARIPSREKMLGMIELRKMLTAMEVEIEKKERLTAF